MSTTEHFGFKRINAGDHFSDDSYKYTDTDRVTMDRIMWQAFTHDHTGAIGSSTIPSNAPQLVLDTTTGAIPAGTRVYYKYTHVDSYGNETSASAESYVDTPQPVSSPGAPTLVANSGSGSLTFGNYLYILSAYTDSTTEESLAVNAAWVTVSAGSSITLTMPATPTGADGFNIYRRRPGSIGYVYLDSVVDGTTTYEDDGFITEDANRSLPSSNTTNSTNAVTITYPDGALPANYTWKIYRTYSSGDYTNSLVHHVVEETFSGSGIITTDYDDLGQATFSGEPPATSFVVNQAGPIFPAGIEFFPIVVEIPVDYGAGISTGAFQAIWVCEYATAEIKGVRAMVIDPPNIGSLIVDVNKGTTTSPLSATTIFTTQANRPTIAQDAYTSSVKIPDITSLSIGDVLTIDVDDGGEGATPSATDLKVYIRLHVTHTATDDTWE